MAQYAKFIGKRVRVEYRAGDLYLPASGTLVADSGRAIFLEEQLPQASGVQQFRWEIPYQCVISMSPKDSF